LLGRLRSLFGGVSSGAGSNGTSISGSNGRVLPAEQTRQSNGLDQFFASIRDRSGLSLLDFAGANQSNVSYITSMGHRLSSEDFVRSLELTFGQHEMVDNQSNPQLMDQFLQENLGFPYDSFDGALVWDALQFLSPHLLQITVDRLFDTLRPDSNLLAFFHSDEKAKQIPLYNYRIADHKTLSLQPRGWAPCGQVFNNRAIEKVFHRYKSVKFFLTRDNLREVIVRR
jgi:hypothetical protein